MLILNNHYEIFATFGASKSSEYPIHFAAVRDSTTVVD